MIHLTSANNALLKTPQDVYEVHVEKSQIAASPKIFFMKNLLTLCAFALCTLTLSAQDEGSSMGAEGTFFLGAGDATQLLNIFSANGVGPVLPTVSYCVADDIAIQLSMNGPTDGLAMNIAGAYFIDDYYVGARLYDVTGTMDLGVGGAKIIPFMGPLFVAPGIEYRFGLDDDASDNLGLTIGFGARF